MQRLIPNILAFAILLVAPINGQEIGESTTASNSNNSREAATKNAAVNTSVTGTELDKVIISAFKLTHDGYSSDEVILNDALNQAFLKECQNQLPNSKAFDINWRLMNLRKAGKLKVKSTKRNRTSVHAISHIAEIASRTMHDKYAISSDKVMADPDRRTEFDAIVKSVDPEADLYRVRKAAFQLRKARKLKPELIARIANWGRQITTHNAKSLQQNPDLASEHPGIYIFRDNTGYLYIGQTDNLRKRLKSHLDQSHNLSLAKYLGKQKMEGITIEVHSFDPNSRAKEVMIRRAYESELIASRKPRFNIQP